MASDTGKRERYLDFWYSEKHDKWLRKIGAGINRVELGGELKCYTEAVDVGDKPMCATEQGGKFDDYHFLGTADSCLTTHECGDNCCQIGE